MRIYGLMVSLSFLAGCSGGNTATPPVPPTGGYVTSNVVQRSTLSLGLPRVALAHTILYSFKGGADGEYPLAGLVDVNGVFYGTTLAGGATGCACGTVFKITKSGAERVIHSFIGGTGDGADPLAGLVNLNGTLYGTTEHGGTKDQGTVFSITTSGVEHVLHSFTGGDHNGDGEYPTSALIAVDGALYGASTNGGTTGSSLGAIYKIAPSSGEETNIYSFGVQNTADGQYPMGALVSANGELYGTTSTGGVNHGSGTVFAIDTSGTNMRELHTFTGGIDSGSPVAALTAIGGELYGTTSGQAIGGGTVFKISTAGGGYQILHTFSGGAKDGDDPLAALVNVEGVLYGTTSQDPSGDDGCVFKITTSGNPEAVVTGFEDNTTDGAHPRAGLLYDTKLYGTTEYGGTSNPGYGTVFALTP